MYLTRLDLFLWGAGFLSNVLLLFILFYRRRAFQFPFFTAIITLEVCKTILLYLVRGYGTKSNYFYAYWSLTLADTLLQLCVVYEVASQVFRPMQRWASDLRRSFGWMVFLSVGLASAITWLASPQALNWMQALATRGNLFGASLMSELFVAMLVISMTAGLPWRSHAGAIAQGLGGYSLVSVLIETGHAYFGVGGDMPAFVLLSQLRMVAYLGCVGYWTVNLASDEQPGRVMTGEMRAAMVTLHAQLAGDLRSLRFRKNK